MTCGQCGAAIQRGDGRFCSHCGAALPDRPRITPEEWVAHVERFEQAEKDPQHAIARGLPAPAPLVGPMVTTAVFSGVFVAACVVMAFFMGSQRDAQWMAVVPAVMAVFVIVAFGGGLVKMRAAMRAPVIRAIAVVVDERTDVSTSGMGDDRSTHTAYYATLQLKDGTRLELGTSGAVSGMTTIGDIGLAVTRAGELIDFHRFARV